MQNADGIYDVTKPWASSAEQLVSERLQQASEATANVAAFAKQPLFPARFGYEQRALTVDDCFAITTTYGDARNDYSRVTSGTQSSSTPSLPLT